MPSPVLESLKAYQAGLKNLRRFVRAEKVSQISKKGLRSEAERLGTLWFSDLVPQLQSRSCIDSKKLSDYGKQFQDLINLSGPSNLRTRYLAVLDTAIRNFREDFILPVQTTAGISTSQLHGLLAGITSPIQNEYLQEATACANHGYYRAAAMLGWCAAIDQIHRAIERIGFAKFNVASSSMASQTKGRFKKFNQVQNITSASELREVFDNTILWVLEGLQLIDINQHTRLHSCFELRCQCSHPGEAPVTEYNLLSFFSDLNEIVFKNHKLAP